MLGSSDELLHNFKGKQLVLYHVNEFFAYHILTYNGYTGHDSTVSQGASVYVYICGKV
jgi:hypothetical protein